MSNNNIGCWFLPRRFNWETKWLNSQLTNEALNIFKYFWTCPEKIETL